MVSNIGVTDRVIRVIAAVTSAGLVAGNVVHGWLAIVLSVFAVLFAVTAVVGWCPLYVPLGISTRRHEARQPYSLFRSHPTK